MIIQKIKRIHDFVNRIKIGLINSKNTTTLNEFSTSFTDTFNNQIITFWVSKWNKSLITINAIELLIIKRKHKDVCIIHAYLGAVNYVNSRNPTFRIVSTSFCLHARGFFVTMVSKAKAWTNETKGPFKKSLSVWC